MTAELALGLDIGTGGVRALIVDAEGTAVSSGSASYPLLTPQPGLAEQRPEDWWTAATRAISDALAPIDKSALVAVGLSGQMHGAVLVDETLQPLRNALLWCDARAAGTAAAVIEEYGRDWLIRTAGNPPLPGFTGPQLRWLHDSGDPALGRARWVLCAKDYLRAMLTGVAAAEPSDASGTGLYSIDKRAWSPELAGVYHADPALLAPIVKSGEIAGRVTSEAARATGLLADTPVAAGAADNAAAALGAGVVSPGGLMVSVGTSGTLLAPRVDALPDPTGRCHLFHHAVAGTWYSMAVVLSAGGALTWWQTLSGSDLDQLSEEAAAIPPGSDGVVVLPYLSGRRMPKDEPTARASIVGLTVAHGRGHLTRAIVEGAGYALADGLACLRDVGVGARRAVLTGGAAGHAVWQEVLSLALPELEFVRNPFEEGAALGAALLGFEAAGLPLDDLLERVVATEAIEPANASPAARETVTAGYRRFRALSNDSLVISSTTDPEDPHD